MGQNREEESEALCRFSKGIVFNTVSAQVLSEKHSEFSAYCFFISTACNKIKTTTNTV